MGWGERVEGGGGKAEREMKIVGACACMWGVMVGEWFAWGGLNNPNDFPDLAESRIWMAALERSCNGFIWLSVCFFIGKERKSRKNEEG